MPPGSTGGRPHTSVPAGVAPCGAHSPTSSLPRLPFRPAGSDQWKMAERKLFNKGIAIYKKDFFLVQKLVSWGSVLGADLAA